MQISNKNTINFQSQNIEIKQVYKIMRNAINHYTTISTSKVEYYDSIKKQNLVKVFKYFKNLVILRQLREPYTSTNLLEKYSFIQKLVK